MKLVLLPVRAITVITALVGLLLSGIKADAPKQPLSDHTLMLITGGDGT